MVVSGKISYYSRLVQINHLSSWTSQFIFYMNAWL